MIYIVRGLMYGDEGKGSIVDYLSKNCSDIIKEGGPQAAHHIVSTNGKMHRSEQMGSGVFNKDVRTFCSKNMFVHPQNLIMENIMLHMAGVHDGMKRMFIDSRCPIVTPLHQIIGRMKEVSRGTNKHGSTGMGVGEAVKDWKKKGDEVLTIGDIYDEELLKEKAIKLFIEKGKEASVILENIAHSGGFMNLYELVLKLTPELAINSYSNFASVYPDCVIYNGDEHLNGILESENNIIFEGSQGTLLDPKFGFPPYVTKTRTTFDSALELIGNKVSRNDIQKIGVIRAYSTRHGVGPFVTEDEFLTSYRPDRYNIENSWQGKFRIGWFDLVAVKYAIMVNGEVDSIALTNLDRLSDLNDIRVCMMYEYNYSNLNEYIYEELNEFFKWTWSGEKLIITEFRKRMYPTDEEITNILMKCKPIYKKFDGWKVGISNVKKMKDLPFEARKYVRFLEDELKTKISIISVGETSENKIEVE